MTRIKKSRVNYSRSSSKMTDRNAESSNSRVDGNKFSPGKYCGFWTHFCLHNFDTSPCDQCLKCLKAQKSLESVESWMVTQFIFLTFSIWSFVLKALIMLSGKAIYIFRM